jgi:ABC-2 type transport system ATP-binding protein
MNVIEAHALGKQFRHTWALRDCTLALPAGHVAALVGSNGAGKTTLLHLAVGLARPSCGTVSVLGGEAAGSARALDHVAFVAQNAPLYGQLSVADTLHLARNLNLRWDQHAAEARLSELGIPMNRKVGRLSGGQQAQLALTVALARRPELLVLDEPLASLDPLARHDFMASLMSGVAAEGISVVFSSHVVAELERVADYLIILAGGQIQIDGDVETLLMQHCLLTGPRAEAEMVSRSVSVIQSNYSVSDAHLLVRTEATQPPPGWGRSPVGLEELVLAYMRAPSGRMLSQAGESSRKASRKVAAK